MFGNRIGWAISAVLLALTALLLWQIRASATRISPPGPIGQSAGRYSLRLPHDPRGPATWMTEEGDAMELYARAVGVYLTDERAFGASLPRLTLESAQHRTLQPAMDLLIQASRRKAPGVFADRPQVLVNYRSHRQALAQLEAMARAAFHLARLYHMAGELERALELYRARYTLGLKLCEERLVYAQWDLGRQLLADAGYLAELEPDRAEAFRRVDAQFAGFYREQVRPVYEAIFVVSPHTGDMAALAQNASEITWRIEAVLALGRCRYSAATAGDQNGASMLIERLLTDADARIRLAARAAHELSEPEFRRLP
jgi:hypothetical protein